jgi:hypothetical protein
MSAARQHHYAPHELLDQRHEFENGVVVTHLDHMTTDDFSAINDAYALQRDARKRLGADFIRVMDVQLKHEAREQV